MKYLMGKNTFFVSVYLWEQTKHVSTSADMCQQCQSAVAIKTYLSIYVSIAESWMLMWDSRADCIIHFRPPTLNISFMVNS